MKDGRVELFIQSEGGLGMFQIPLRDPRVFFGRISLPSDQEGTGGWSSAVAYDLLDFVFLFSIDKVRGGAGKFQPWTSFSQEGDNREAWKTGWILQVFGRRSW